MLWKRAGNTYGETPEAVTPYQRAAQDWDDRIGSARVQARNWRLATLVSMGMSLVLAGGLVWRSTQNWLVAYAYSTDRAAATLNTYAQEHDPFAEIGKRSVSVDVTSVVRASDDSFTVRWRETAFRNGAETGREYWTATLSVVTDPPRDADTLHQNPLGLYVHGINWSKDLS